MKQQKSLTRNALLNMCKTVVTTFFPLITYMYVSRIFGTEVYGKISFANSFVAYFLLLAMLGINSYATKEAAKIRDNKKVFSKFVHEIMILNILSMLVAYITLFVVIIYFPRVHTYRKLILVYSITIFLKVIGMEWLYAAVEDYFYITVRTILVQILSLICVFLFVHGKEDFIIYSLIQVTSIGGNNIFNFFHSRKYVIYSRMLNKNILCHLKPVLSLFLMTLFINIFTHLDTVMLGIIREDRFVGLYSAGDKMSSMITGMIGAIPAVMLPRVAYYKEKGDIVKIKEIIVKTANVILMLSIPATIGIIILGKPIILFFSGKAYYDAIITIKILAFRILLSPINGLFVLYIFIPLGYEKRSLIVTAVAAVINLSMNLFLIPIYAHNGAAFATVFAEVIEFILNLFFINQFISIKEILNKIWQYGMATLPIILLWFFFSNFDINIFVNMFILVAVSVPVYFGILIALKNEYIHVGLEKIKRLR